MASHLLIHRSLFLAYTVMMIMLFLIWVPTNRRNICMLLYFENWSSLHLNLLNTQCTITTVDGWSWFLTSLSTPQCSWLMSRTLRPASRRLTVVPCCVVCVAQTLLILCVWPGGTESDEWLAITAVDALHACVQPVIRSVFTGAADVASPLILL